MSRGRTSDISLDDDVSIPVDLANPIREAIDNTPRRKRVVHAEAKLLVTLGYWVLPIARLSKGYPATQFNANSATKSLKTVDEWFHPDTGRYAGWNLGIPCGQKEYYSLLVADADRHGKGDGVEEWNRLVKQHGKPEPHPWATTPNAGEHHLFQSHIAFSRKSTKESTESGLEILGGKDGSFTSFVLVYPSVVKDREGRYKQYNWQVHPKECRPPPVPDWLPTTFDSNKQSHTGFSRGNENVTADDLEQIVPLDQVKQMLATVDPNELSYDEWLSIGMAIHSQHPDAQAVWDDWSKGGDRYQPGECVGRWAGFNANSAEGRVTIGTLFYHAKKHNWTPQDHDILGDPVSVAVAELNQTYAHVVEGGHERILRLRPDHRSGDLHYDLLAPSAFKRLFPGQWIKNPSWDKAKKLPDAWIDSPYRRSYPLGLRLCPSNESAAGIFNTWNGFAYEPEPGDCSLFLRHVRNVICRGNTALYEWVMDWCADCVQDPSNLKGTAIVMRGKEGTGKGTFADTIGKLFGPHYVHLIDPSHLMGNFNAHLIEAIFVFADEITWGGNVKSQGKLKGLVSEKRLIGERKGIDAVTYRNYAHVMIASNEDWVIPAGGSSRRWLVLDIDNSKANDRVYFKAIHDELDNGGYEALLHELQTRKIESNLRFAPETEALAEQRRLSASSRDKFFDYLDQRLGENNWDSQAFADHADYGRCLVKSHIYSDYCRFTESLRGTPWSDTRFWKQWLSVFPYARGNQRDWPRTRILGKLARVSVLKPRQQMCVDFERHYGTASDEVRAADGDWNGNNEGC